MCSMSVLFLFLIFFFFFKQKTAYEMRISDWSSDVWLFRSRLSCDARKGSGFFGAFFENSGRDFTGLGVGIIVLGKASLVLFEHLGHYIPAFLLKLGFFGRSEEHTSDLQSLMSISYAVFCLKKKNKYNTSTT